MFTQKIIDIHPGDKVKEGWLTKESRFMKKWRPRWCVLTNEAFYTFEKEKEYINPTETVEIGKIRTVKTDETRSNIYFKLESENGSFIFMAKTFEEKESWIGAIGKAMIKRNKSNVIIENE